MVGSQNLTIRFERDGDWPAIHEVNRSAFETQAEADLVDRLRHQGASVVSLVADAGGAIVGHILFTPVTIAGDDASRTLGLAPLAVRPGRQRQGIGSQLVRAGLDASRRNGSGAVVVVGHAAFYPKFGFVPASRFGLRCEYDVADEVFMAQELVPGALAGRAGLVCYHPAFAEL